MYMCLNALNISPLSSTLVPKLVPTAVEVVQSAATVRNALQSFRVPNLANLVVGGVFDEL